MHAADIFFDYKTIETIVVPQGFKVALIICFILPNIAVIIQVLIYNKDADCVTKIKKCFVSIVGLNQILYP